MYSGNSTTIQNKPYSSVKPLVILLITIGLSHIVYWLMSRPYNFFRLYPYGKYTLLHHAQTDPNARWVLLVAFLLLFGLYFVGWQTTKQAHGRGAWLIVLGGALMAAIILMFMYPIGAADVFDYIMHGRIMSVYGANPYIQVGREFAHDPFYRYMAWQDLPSTYGPIWSLISGAATWAAGHHIVTNMMFFKLIVGFFFFASIGVVALILNKVAPNYVLAGVVVLAWNPVVLYETFANGHNDIVMMFWVLAAICFSIYSRHTLAILMLIAGTLVKFIPILLLPIAGMIALREIPDTKARVRFIGLTGTAVVAFIVLAYMPFWRGPETITIFQRQALYTTSLPAVLWAWMASTVGTQYAAFVISQSAGISTLVFAFWCGIRAWYDNSWASFPRNAFWVLLFYLLFTCLWFQEWYTLWPVSLAAILLPVSEGFLFLTMALNIGGITKPTIFVPRWLWLRPMPSRVWWEQRLGPAVMALPWLALLLYLTKRVWHLTKQKLKAKVTAVSNMGA